MSSNLLYESIERLPKPANHHEHNNDEIEEDAENEIPNQQQQQETTTLLASSVNHHLSSSHKSSLFVNDVEISSGSLSDTNHLVITPLMIQIYSLVLC